MNKAEQEQIKYNRDHKYHKISESIYPCLLEIINKYQTNYKGEDKMSREFMMGEIEKFKPADLV